MSRDVCFIKRERKTLGTGELREQLEHCFAECVTDEEVSLRIAKLPRLLLLAAIGDELIPRQQAVVVGVKFVESLGRSFGVG